MGAWRENVKSGNVRGLKRRLVRNFYFAEVQIKESRFFILLNRYYPYIAFATQIEFGNIQFVDKPYLEEYFAPFYQVLKVKELNTPFDPIENTQLNCAELEKIAHWKPQTIGEVIFNYWDNI